MHRRYGNMQGVCFRTGRNAAFRDQLLRESPSLLVNGHLGDPLESLESTCCGLDVPG